MAVVSVAGEWIVVKVDGEVIGKFRAMLDANCFALQLIERELVCCVRLNSGEIIKEWAHSCPNCVA